jgi:energy-coupling factor transporter ATP-binding protein EcfA2
MLSDLSSAVTQAAIETRRGELWMLHAAGVASSDGGVIALVGRSGAGKTTATRVLARTWGYVSDETIGVEDDGRVHLYRKPLSVITDGHNFKAQHSPGELGLHTPSARPLRLRRLVLLDRDPSHTHARLVPVTLAEALVALAPQSSALAAMTRPLRTMAAFVERTGGVLRAEYAEASDLIELLSEAMTGAAPEVAPSTLPAAAPTSRRPVAEGDGIVRYHRRDVVDWCPLSDGTIAVLTAETDGRGSLRVLAGAAPALWHAADGVTRDGLLSALTDGAPDEHASRALDGILDQLVEAGLLTVA